MADRKIYSDKIKGFNVQCTMCRDNHDMVATGFIYEDELAESWVIEFECTISKELIQSWDIDWEPLIQEELKKQGIS